MSNKMLIDATHPEETRVVVLRGNRVEEFDFEAADRQQLRGNIYLAKVTRVEPSLQAAFVEYGGNRHGFLAFSEIHPDYYQIPVADRRALLEEHAAEAAEEARRETRQDDQAVARREEAERQDDEAGSEVSELAPEPADDVETVGHHEDGGPEDEVIGEAGADAPADAASPAEAGSDAAAGEEPKVESIGAEDALEEIPERRKPRPRQYKIQEVIKRRQVLLVQVVKEERGTKGAALTTYLSLAGRYSVLMPNTARGGGISRKITNAVDRKRLKSVAGELEVPEGMGVILRTAGANRTKTEIKRDFEYLLRLWENVRELTLRSTAPKLVYEEGSLIKRSIRDLYSREIDQIVVAGEDAYREAKDFMRMLMPSHAKNVQPYRDDTPIFSRNSVETQLDAMFSPQVTLRSGGYIVINQTEALVAVDVNSGRSTREHNIEDTALNTNLEAAEEVSRQLRLRDLAGLIVIDFIDMEENRNNRAVERKLKDCLRLDRARIQLGRISHFGLMEMSRQRIRTGVLESSVVACPHCRGTGQVRSISSLSLQILRALEDYLLRHNGHHLVVRTRPEVALYVLNQKRQHLTQLESRFGLSITLLAETPHDGVGYTIDRGEPVLEPRPIEPAAPRAFAPEDPADDEVFDEEEVVDDGDNDEPARDDDERQSRGRGQTRREGSARPDRSDRSEAGDVSEAAGDDEGRTGRRRRRKRRGGGGEDRPDRDRQPQGRDTGDVRQSAVGSADDSADADGVAVDAGSADSETGEFRSRPEEENGDARRRRRGRRGGRRRGRGREDGNGAGEARGTIEGSAGIGAESGSDEESLDGDSQVQRDENGYGAGNDNRGEGNGSLSDSQWREEGRTLAAANDEADLPDFVASAREAGTSQVASQESSSFEADDEAPSPSAARPGSQELAAPDSADPAPAEQANQLAPVEQTPAARRHRPETVRLVEPAVALLG